MVGTMNKLTCIFLWILFSLCMSACGPAKVYDGDSMVNYPDVAMIFDDNLAPYQKAPYTFKLITIEHGQKDSSFLKAKDVDWDALKAPFLKANLYQKKLDKHYDINVFTDTIYNKLTLLLTAIDPNEITSKMSITAKKPENKIMTLYAETRDAGFFTTTEYKLLFVNKRTLQVQETKKYPFMKARTKVQTLTFLN